MFIYYKYINIKVFSQKIDDNKIQYRYNEHKLLKLQVCYEMNLYISVSFLFYAHVIVILTVNVSGSNTVRGGKYFSIICQYHKHAFIMVFLSHLIISLSTLANTLLSVPFKPSVKEYKNRMNNIKYETCL